MRMKKSASGMQISLALLPLKQTVKEEKQFSHLHLFLPFPQNKHALYQRYSKSTHHIIHTSRINDYMMKICSLKYGCKIKYAVSYTLSQPNMWWIYGLLNHIASWLQIWVMQLHMTLLSFVAKGGIQICSHIFTRGYVQYIIIKLVNLKFISHYFHLAIIYKF